MWPAYFLQVATPVLGGYGSVKITFRANTCFAVFGDGLCCVLDLVQLSLLVESGEAEGESVDHFKFKKNFSLREFVVSSKSKCQSAKVMETICRRNSSTRPILKI